MQEPNNEIMIELPGKSVEEAIELAVQKLGVESSEELDIELVQEGTAGILGIGAAPTIIKATMKPNTPPEEVPTDETERTAVAVLNGAMRAGNLSVKAMVTSHMGRYLYIELVGRDACEFGGTQLEALQEIMNLILTRKYDLEARCVLDADGYRERRAEKLHKLALEIAEEVKANHSEAELDPLPPYERRVVHMALKDDPQISTYSEGEGSSRHIVIAFAEEPTESAD